MLCAGSARSLLLLVSLTLVFSGSTRAQTGQGVVTGNVFDPSDAAVPAAELTLTNQGTNVSQRQTTGIDGSYRFSLVPPGTYWLAVKAPGFVETRMKDIVVNASQTVPVSLTLSLSTASATVEVRAEATLVQTASSDLTSDIDQTAILSTALISRNVFDLAFIAPAVTQGMNLQPAAGGVREYGTAYLLNGADDNDNFTEGAINVNPPLESVAEFTVLTNNMSAQYGRGSGAVVSAVQVSGTNAFHGVAYEFNRNKSLNSSDFFQNRQGSPAPHYVRNQFGGQISGPVRRNKTFFAFAYDQVTEHTSSESDTPVPTPAEYAKMQSTGGPLARKLLAVYPLRTSNALCPDQAQSAPESIGHIGCLHLPDPVSQPQKNWFAKLDQNFSSYDRLNFTANLNWSDLTDALGGGSPANQVPMDGHTQNHSWNLSLVETHVFSARLLNELTVAHNRRYHNKFTGSGDFTMPEIFIDGADYGIPLDFGPYSGSVISSFTQDRWQLSDNLSWNRGRHSFKFGGGYQYGIVYRNWDAGAPGAYEFGNVFGPTPQSLGYMNANGTISRIADPSESNFQNDFPYMMQVAIDPHTGARADAYRHYTMADAYWFLQDDWKLSPRLTLNLGLRWDRYGAPSEINGKLAGFVNLHGYDPQSIAAARVGPMPSLWKTRNKDFGPRIGFAWDVFGDQRSAVRGGFGISYDRIFDNVWSNAAWNPPFYALASFNAAGADAVYYTLPATVGPAYVPDTLPGPAGRVALRTMDVALKDSSVQNYYFGLERQFLRNVLLRVNYQGSLGRHLPVLMNLNRYDGLRYNSTLALVPPNSLYSQFNYRANNLTSSYSGLTTELQKRMSNGLQFQIGYTWSKLMDYGSGLFDTGSAYGYMSLPPYFVSNSRLEFERGPGGFDHTQAFKVNFTWEAPFFRERRGILNQALGGWQISGFYQGYSGHPLVVYNGRGRYRGNALDPNGLPENIGGDYNLDGVPNDRPAYTGGTAADAYSGLNPADGIFKDLHKIGCGVAGAKSTNVAACNASNAVGTASTLFVNPGGYGVRFGPLGRNVFRGPWFNGLDVAIMKHFRVRESVRLQVRGEALNVLNHPNFDGIDTNLNSSTFGRATFLVGSAPARRLQVGMRLSF